MEWLHVWKNIEGKYFGQPPVIKLFKLGVYQHLKNDTSFQDITKHVVFLIQNLRLYWFYLKQKTVPIDALHMYYIIS